MPSLLAAQFKQKIGRLTQRVVDEKAHLLERVEGIRLFVKIADSVEPPDHVVERAVSEDVVHGRIPEVFVRLTRPPLHWRSGKTDTPAFVPGRRRRIRRPA